MLFLAMQVRVMAACMESQIDKQEYTASAQSRARDGTGGINQPSDVCVPLSSYSKSAKNSDRKGNMKFRIQVDEKYCFIGAPTYTNKRIKKPSNLTVFDFMPH